LTGCVIFNRPITVCINIKIRIQKVIVYRNSIVSIYIIGNFIPYIGNIISCLRNITIPRYNSLTLS